MNESAAAVVVEGVAGEAAPIILSERVRELRDRLLTGLVERDVAMRLALVAALAGEHLLLLGPPGTAKSLLARRLKLAFTGAAYFERLLTRFSVPEELFGPLSIKGLEEDRYERLTEAYLPTASIAFLDEIFKANSAILNALLTLLNEREFDNGARRVRVPLISVIGASNEHPEGDELEALFDRFLLRLHVAPVSAAGFGALLGLRGDGAPEVPAAIMLSREELDELRRASEAVEVPADVVALLGELRTWTMAEKLAVSDRRWRKIVRLLQVSAFTNGRTAASIWDGWLLQFCIGATAEQRTKVYEWYAARVGVSAAMDSTQLTRIVTVWEGQLARDRESRSQMRDRRGRLQYKDPAGELTASHTGAVRKLRGAEVLFLAPDGAAEQRYQTPFSERSNGGKGYTAGELDELVVNGQYVRHWPRRSDYVADQSNWLMQEADLPPAMEPTRFKQSHLDDCARQLAQHHDGVVAYQRALDDHRRALAAQVSRHLWVTPDFIGPATTSLDKTKDDVAQLRQRLERVQAGFASLPREQEPGDDAPVGSAATGSGAVPGAQGTAPTKAPSPAIRPGQATRR